MNVAKTAVSKHTLGNDRAGLKGNSAPATTPAVEIRNRTGIRFRFSSAPCRIRRRLVLPEQAPPLDLELELRPLREQHADRVERRVALGQDVRLVRLEVHVLEPDHAGVEQLGLALLDLDRASGRVDLETRGRVRALVDPVGNAVAIR